MARTAAIVGTATATRNAVNRHQADKNAAAYTQAMNNAQAQQAPPPQQQQYYAPPPPQEQYAPPQPAMPAPQDDVTTQLERLGALKAQGLLSDEEFAAAKQKLLAG
jgi:hypothetical protein